MLRRILRSSVVVQRPIDTTVFFVQTIVFQESVAMLCFVQQALVLQKSIGIGEEPGNPAVQNTALFCLFIQIQIIIQVAVIATEFVISHSFPEGNDSFCQVLFDLFSHSIASLLKYIGRQKVLYIFATLSFRTR